MITAAENAANLKSADNLAESRLGVDSSNLTYEQRGPFLHEKAKIILEHPERFAPATVATARAVVERSHQPLQDDSFNWSQFSSEVVTNALSLGESVAAVGEGAKSALNLTRWLLPLALVAAVVFLLLGLKRRVGA